MPAVMRRWGMQAVRHCCMPSSSSTMAAQPAQCYRQLLRTLSRLSWCVAFMAVRPRGTGRQAGVCQTRDTVHGDNSSNGGARKVRAMRSPPNQVKVKCAGGRQSRQWWKEGVQVRRWHIVVGVAGIALGLGRCSSAP